MDINKAEFAAIEEVASQAGEEALLELKEMQLALVGGGCGEVLFG